jgi:hypothetical protein
MRQQQPNKHPQDSPWRHLLERDIAEMMTDPHLSDQEKAELLRQLELPEDRWEPVEIEGEPLSETIIKLRGER